MDGNAASGYTDLEKSVRKAKDRMLELANSYRMLAGDCDTPIEIDYLNRASGLESAVIILHEECKEVFE